MSIFPFLAVTFIMKFIAVIFILCAVILILLVLIQKGKGGGLSGALTGGAVGGILGSQTKGPMTWITIIIVSVFLLLAVVMAKYYKPTPPERGTEQTQQRIPTAQQQEPAPPLTSPVAGDVNVDVNLVEQ